MSTRREVLSLAIPALAQGLISTILIFTDRLILGQYNDLALGAMQISGTLMWSVFSVLSAISIGVLAIVGRSVGEENHSRIGHTLGTACVISVLTGIIIAVAGYTSAPSLALLIGGPNISDTTRSLANTYNQTVFCAAPLSLLLPSLIAAFQATGDTRTPMWLTLIAGTGNLLISWLLVFGIGFFPELGMLGAAIGTVVSYILGCGIATLMIHRNTILRVSWPTHRELRALMKVSVPSIGEKIIFHAGFLAFARMVAELGDTAVITHQALMAIESLGYISASAFGIAASALVAQKLGAKKVAQAWAASWTAARLGFGFLCAIGVFFWLAVNPLLELFSTDPEVITLGTRCMLVAIFCQPLMALTDVFGGSLRGAGDTRSPMIVALIGPVLLRLSACWFFAYYCSWGLLGIWIGSTIDWFFRCIILGWIFRRGKWTTAIV